MRKLLCKIYKLHILTLRDLRAIEADNALRKMPKGTYVCWHSGRASFVCYIRNSKGFDIWDEGPIYSCSRANAVLSAWYRWRQYCDYNSIPYDSDDAPLNEFPEA